MKTDLPEIRTLVRLALPIVLANCGLQAMMTVDTLMVTRIGTEAIAAAGLGNVWIMGTTLFALGILLGMDPIVTQAHGAGDGRRAGIALQRGIVLSLVVGVGLAVLWLFTEDFLLLAGQDPDIAHQAHLYALVQIPCIPFFMVFIALRQYLQGRGIVTPTAVVIVVANVANGFFNWMFIFGALGAPELGLVGAGIATALTRVLMLVALVVLVRVQSLHAGAWVPWSREALSRRGILEILRYGVPIAIQLSLEVGAFGVSSLLAGTLGTADAAAHLIVLNMASLSFMVPLGISFAAVTRVGNLIGAGQYQRAQHSARIALGLGGAVMCGSGLVFLLGRNWLPTLYGAEPEVLALCAVILPIAAAFQVFDGVQAVGSGVLRGMGRTVPAALFNFVGYWVLALPLAWWMAIRGGIGLKGIWWGLAAALALVAGALLVWILRRGPASMQPAQRAGTPASSTTAASTASSPARISGQAESASLPRLNSMVKIGNPQSPPTKEPNEPGVG